MFAAATTLAASDPGQSQSTALSAEIRLANSHGTFDSEGGAPQGYNRSQYESWQREQDVPTVEEFLKAIENAERRKAIEGDSEAPILRLRAPSSISFAAGSFQIKGLVGDDLSPPRLTADGERQPLFQRGPDDPELTKHTYAFDIQVPVEAVGDRSVVVEACDAARNCVRETVVVAITASPSETAQGEGEHTALLARLEAAEAERQAAEARAREAEEKTRKLALAREPAGRPATTTPVNRPNIAARNHALIVGNNDYRRLPNLRSAVGDAEAVAQVLTSRYAFRAEDVTLLLDADRRTILVALEDLRHKLGPDDRLLIYYAGHGEIDPVTEEGFWQPVDAEPGRQFTWIANDDVRRYLKGMPAKHVLVVADSCFSGSLTRSAGAYASIPKDRFFTEIDASVSRKAISSGGTKPVMDSGSQGHSVFAYYLLKALRENERPYLAAFELFGKLVRAVTNNSSQKPEFGTVQEAGDEGAGDFTFVLQGAS
jgi:hypothetical protein